MVTSDYLAVDLIHEPTTVAISRRQLEQPTGITRYSLRFSPAYAKLRDRPEFESLLADSTLPPRR